MCKTTVTPPALPFKIAQQIDLFFFDPATFDLVFVRHLMSNLLDVRVTHILSEAKGSLNYCTSAFSSNLHSLLWRSEKLQCNRPQKCLQLVVLPLQSFLCDTPPIDVNNMSAFPRARLRSQVIPARRRRMRCLQSVSVSIMRSAPVVWGLIPLFPLPQISTPKCRQISRILHDHICNRHHRRVRNQWFLLPYPFECYYWRRSRKF